MDGADHVDLRVVAVDHLAMLRPGADYLDRGTVAIDVVGTILAVVLDHEDGRVLPVLAVGDLVHDLADCEVPVGDLSPRIRCATGVVAGQPEHVEVRGAVLLEVLLPDLLPVDVRDVDVELRVVVNRDLVQGGDRGLRVRFDGCVHQLARVATSLDVLGGAVVLLPGRPGWFAQELGELAEVSCGGPR